MSHPMCPDSGLGIPPANIEDGYHDTKILFSFFYHCFSHYNMQGLH